MNNEEFINTVWDKYNNYTEAIIKEKFFKKHQYKYAETIRKIGTAISFIVGMIATTGIVYASVVTYQFVQKSTNTDFDKHRGYDYSQDMLCSNSIYYKKIYTYSEYVEAQKMWNNLVELEEKDFNDSFVMILSGENYNTTSLYVSNISADDQKMYIELKKTEAWEEENTTISIKVSKKLDREIVEIHNLPNLPDTSEKYVDINSLTKYYTIEQALEDGCFTIKEQKLISNNKNQLDSFIENCEQGIDDVIRIYNYGYFNTIEVTDIEYKNGRINICWRHINMDDNDIKYCTGNEIIKSKFKRSNHTYIDYALSDEIGNQQILCSFEI